MNRESDIVTAPAYWREYLLNGNAASLYPSEKICADAWLKESRVFSVIDATGPTYESIFFVLYDKTASAPGSLQDFVVLFEPKGV